MRALLLLLPLVIGLPFAQGQSGLQPGTALTIDAGTTLEFQGNQTFTIPPGAAVANEGTIVFGTLAALNETGVPINGSGTETTTRSYPTPMSAVDPAGLGLELTTAVAPGTVTITRGHIPFVDNGGLNTVARWFDVNAVVNSGLAADVSFHVDPTELNGLSEPNLILHARGAGNYWTAYLGTVDLIGHRVLGTGLDSLGLFSLFAEISTGISPATVSTPVPEAVLIDGQLLLDTHGAPTKGEAIVIDALGRPLASGDLMNGRTCIDLSKAAPGAYVVHVGATAIKFAKP